MFKRHDIVHYQYPVKGKNNLGVVDSIDGDDVMLWVKVPDMQWPILIHRYLSEISMYKAK
jgi:hypothetical protein